ncbi:general substrate transporter [Tylopilus felleus]
MLAVLASMGGYIVGYYTSEISDILMDDFLLRFATCSTHSLLVSLLSIGNSECWASALIGVPTADFLGRRYAMSAECIVFIIGVIVRITSTIMLQQYAVGRLISGLGRPVPMYQTETAFSQIHGTLTAIYQLFITFALILGISILFMPESPRNVFGVLFTHLCLVTHPSTYHYITQHEVEEIWMDVEKVTKGGWVDCFRSHDKTLYCTLLGMTLQSLRQLTGRIAPSSTSGSFVTQIILGAVNFVCTFGGMYFMERFGRRWPLICGGIWQSALSTATNWTWIFLLAFSVQLVIGMTFLRVRYLVGSVTVVYVFLYESSDISLENVDMMYTDPKCKPWTSRQWAPPRHLSRRDVLEPTRSAEERKQGGGSLEGMIERQRPMDV